MEAFDAALEMLDGFGTEFGPGLSNHGPMAAEALTTLGREDVVERWVAAYRSRLEPREVERDPITAGDWREALGAPSRVGDWIAFFERELGDAGVDMVLATWLPRLAPGAMAAAAHGIIRTAHAVRALGGAASNELRRTEVATGLGYWAARYQELPGAPRPTGAKSALEALDDVPVIAEADRGAFLIFEQVRAVDAVSGFSAAVDSFGQPADPDEALDAVIAAAAHAYVGCDRRTEIAFVHGVTGPSALRVLLPYLPDGDGRRLAVTYAWQVVAAIRSAYGARRLPDVVIPDAGAWDDLVDRAVADGDGDEHAIKMVEACRREHARTGSNVLVAAARRAAGAPIAWDS
ncbi:MAG TPA: questin oxidase family protein [Acidimicrobiales bacterium]|nr:questin oxidase family protein [Acidimicrobiales bacterium]